MGETVYRIEELHATYPDWEGSGCISKAELKRRLSFIMGYPEKLIHDWENRISILLHGEGKELPIPRPGEWPNVPLPAGKPIPSAEAERLPKPEPNAETHDQWIERMPRQMLCTEWYEWADALCEWLLEEPLVPQPDEWDEWAEKVARQIGRWYVNPRDLIESIKCDLLSIPCNPGRKKNDGTGT